MPYISKAFFYFFSNPMQYQPKSVRDGNSSSISVLAHVDHNLELNRESFRFLVSQVAFKIEKSTVKLSFQIQEDLKRDNSSLPQKLYSYEEWLSEKFGQHGVVTGRISNMEILRDAYCKSRHDEIWSLLEDVGP